MAGPTQAAAQSAWDVFPSAQDYASAPPNTPAQKSPWDVFPSADQYANQTIGPADRLPPVTEDASKMAPMSTQAAASLPTDDNARVKYFAAQRFPNLPLPDALDRYFWKDNRLAYKGDDGKAYYEEPTSRPPTSLNDAVQDVKAVASMAGPAIPATTGTIGGIATSEFGGGVPGAAAAAAGGDAVRQGLANLITGEEKSWPERAWQSGKAALEQGVGQLFGLGVGKALPGKTPTFDIPEATTIGDAARKFNIPLTAGEETGNRTLLRRQKILANTTDADQTFENFYRGRNEKVGNAVDYMLNRVSPTTPSARIASSKAVEGAQAAVGAARADMQAQAKPFYDSSLAQGNEIDPRLLGVESRMDNIAVQERRGVDRRQAGGTFIDNPGAPDSSQIVRLGRIRDQGLLERRGADRRASSLEPDSNGLLDTNAVYIDIPKHFDPSAPLTPVESTIIKGAQDAARSDKVLGPTLAGWSDNSMYALDATKKHMDDMISAARQNGENYKASVLGQAREKLVTMMDKAFPDYAKARGIYEEGMPAVNNIERGVTGDMAKLENNDTLRASQIVFGKGSSPEDIRAARDAYEAAGKAGKLPNWQDNWNALVRSHLEQTFNEIPESSTGSVTNLGGTFYKAIYGNGRKQAMIDAATEHDPGMQRDLLDLMTALNATGRAMKGESITAFAQMGQKELADEARGFIPKAIETVEIWRTPSRVANYIADIQAGRYNAKMAELLTTPEGRSKLRELRKLGPGSAGAVVGLSQLLTAGGVGAVSDRLNQKPDGPVANPGYQAPAPPAPKPVQPPPMAPAPSIMSDEPWRGQ